MILDSALSVKQKIFGLYFIKLDIIDSAFVKNIPVFQKALFLIIFFLHLIDLVFHKIFLLQKLFSLFLIKKYPYSVDGNVGFAPKTKILSFLRFLIFFLISLLKICSLSNKWSELKKIKGSWSH